METRCHGRNVDVTTCLDRLALSSASSDSGEDLNAHKASSTDSDKLVLSFSPENSQDKNLHKTPTQDDHHDNAGDQLAVSGMELSSGEDVDIQGQKNPIGDDYRGDLVDAPSGGSAGRQQARQGLLYGQSPEDLRKFSTKIHRHPPYCGFYISTVLSPRYENGVLHYREKHEYRVEKEIQADVCLCSDLKSGVKFVLKKIRKVTRPLVGLDFLSLHSHRGSAKKFLPKLYGVYKDKDETHIYLEFVEGGTVERCRWDVCQIQVFAETLLSAISELHKLDLVHGDIKLGNVMMRELLDPKSVVIIDFESAKHPNYPLKPGGYTLQYLPPWNRRLLELTKYNPVLKTMDLWAVACILIWFLVDLSAGNEKKTKPLWHEEMSEIHQKCPDCNPHMKVKVAPVMVCSTCQAKFMTKLETEGDKILHVHLRHPLNFKTQDENLALDRLKDLLFYLIDTSDVDSKNVDEALNIIRGNQINLH